MSLPDHERKRGWLKPTFIVFFATVVFPLVLTASVSGKSAAEKLLTTMVQPLFIAIATVLAIGFVLLRRNERRVGATLICGASLMWVVSMPFFASRLIDSWEASIESSTPSASEPFDYLIVLGGGTSVAPDGRAQFSSAGDRVGYAASLYLSGVAKRLVTTGDTLHLDGSLSGSFQPKDDPSTQTKKIWMGLGIPAEAISELAGQNTFSEMASLKEHPEYWQGKRCGILTSAFHLPRAMKLAERVGVQAKPIAADHRTSTGPVTFNQFLPETDGLVRFQMIFKEWLAMRISR
ncbi:MAG: YdcF family protein [Planctomycetota bacterium]|nr:YdcF family protein [Planctomycetota bacterium]